jgi:MoaA/NifB/PqqE/SkfB family radical SAM enzyme
VFEYVPKFREMLKEAGRDPATFPISLFSGTEDPDTLKRYRDMGIVRVVVSLTAAKADVVLPVLDKWAKLISTL